MHPQRPAAERLALVTADGHRTEARLFRPPPVAGPPRARVLLLPAMGVRARYYDAVGEALADAGCVALLAELRGQGTSSHRAARKVDWGYEELVREDAAAAVDALARETAALGPAPTLFLGHSLGGHLAGMYLAAHPGAADALLLVASGTNYFRNWGLPRGLVLLSQIQLGGLIARGLGFFPGRQLGFGDLQARQEIVDWARVSRRGRFEPRGAHVDYEAAMARLSTRVVSVSLEGDALAPRAAVEHLAGKFTAARRSHLHLTESDVPAACLHHFAWARRPGPVLAQILGRTLSDLGTP